MVLSSILLLVIPIALLCVVLPGRLLSLVLLVLLLPLLISRLAFLHGLLLGKEDQGTLGIGREGSPAVDCLGDPDLGSDELSLELVDGASRSSDKVSCPTPRSNPVGHLVQETNPLPPLLWVVSVQVTKSEKTINGKVLKSIAFLKSLPPSVLKHLLTQRRLL